MGHTDIAREILEKYSATVAAQDNEGKTPLHYAAAIKDGGEMYDLLTEHGADESKLDNVSVIRICLQKGIITRKEFVYAYAFVLTTTRVTRPPV